MEGFGQGAPGRRVSSRNALRFTDYQRPTLDAPVVVNETHYPLSSDALYRGAQAPSAFHPAHSSLDVSRSADSATRGTPFPGAAPKRGRLLLIDDHTLFRTGMRLILADHPAIATIIEAGSIMSAIECLGGQSIDLILLDVQLPGINGLDGAQLLKRAFPMARIILLSGSIDLLDPGALATLGVSAQLRKSEDPERLIAAILCCLTGHAPAAKPERSVPRRDSVCAATGSLTARQIEVLTHLCLGRSNKVIAAQLGLSENTVRVHVAAILDHLCVSSRTEAVIEAQRRGVVSL